MYQKQFDRFEQKVWLSSPTMHGEELEYIKEAFDTNWMSTVGKNIDETERMACEKAGCKYAVALSAGTAALHMAVKLAGIKPGQKDFCSDMTFDATVNPVVYEGGVPVFIDSEYDTWNMDPVALEKAFEIYPDVKVVVVAHLYGTPGKIDELRAVCEKHGAVIIEDAAESFGASYKGQQTGTFGAYNAISFNGNKIITGSAGGMFLTNSKEDCEKVKKWSTQARENAPWYQHEELGYNYRMSNICAGIGCGQMTVLEKHIAHHRHVHALYEQAFADIEGITLKSNPAKEFDANYWLCTILIDPVVTGFDYEELRVALDAKGIETRPLWKPMHLQPVFAHNPCYIDGTAEKLFNKGLCIPAGPFVTDEDVAYIVNEIRKQLR